MNQEKSLCLDITDNHVVTIEAIKSMHKSIDTYYIRKRFFRGLKYLISGKHKKLIIPTYCISYKIYILVIIGKIIGKSVVVGIHCGNQFLDRERISLKEYLDIKGRGKIIDYIRYHGFMIANRYTALFIRRLCKVFCIDKALENYLECNGCTIDPIFTLYEKETRNEIQVERIRGKSILLYGRLDEGRIDLDKLDKLFDLVCKCSLQLTIIADQHSEQRIKKRYREILNNISFVTGPVDNLCFERNLRRADYLVSIIAEAPVIKQLHREEYNNTVISGIKLDSLIYDRPICVI